MKNVMEGYFSRKGGRLAVPAVPGYEHRRERDIGYFGPSFHAGIPT